MKTLPMQLQTRPALSDASPSPRGIAWLSCLVLRRMAALLPFDFDLTGGTGTARRIAAKSGEAQAKRLIKTAIRTAKPGLQGSGTVALVGAGPGSKDLITLRGVQRMQEADVIFYDRLIEPEILDLAPAKAKRIYVGKAPGCHHWPQEKISEALVAIAGQGKRVVRLKCGDPGVFARGAEEADALAAANIPYEIVPGVTAASAASAALGGFLTERGTCDTLVLATGQTKDRAGNASWICQLQPGTRMAIYMGVGAAESTARTLSEAGLAQKVSIDIVSRAQQCDQVIAHCTATTLVETIQRQEISNPAIMFLTRTHDA
ncbi:uroporphyrinogen-III C-methyltransferase [Pseudophaeobacter sp.]|uniref:uroporphyrinogen-III C-methyltransferase n=1 Tax=Pseudophaeobacter sp. TaxID=1971739 RepID=UPI0032978FA0